MTAFSSHRAVTPMTWATAYLPATFGYVARELGKRNIAFICTRVFTKAPRLGPELKSVFGGVYVANEGFTREEAEAVVAAGEADAVAFGKLFLANPDLPRRFALARRSTRGTPTPFTAMARPAIPTIRRSRNRRRLSRQREASCASCSRPACRSNAWVFN